MTDDTRARRAAAGPDVVARLRRWGALDYDTHAYLTLDGEAVATVPWIRHATDLHEDLAAAAAAIEARDAEIARLEAEVASLRLTLGGRTFSATAPEPIGCPAPGMCVQVAEIARLRAVLQRIADGALLGTNSAAVARAALAPPPASDGGEA